MVLSDTRGKRWIGASEDGAGQKDPKGGRVHELDGFNDFVQLILTCFNSFSVGVISFSVGWFQRVST